MQRPLTRVRLVLGSARAGSAGASERATATAEALANALADALAIHGVHVRQQVAGSPPDGAPRADAAIWLPDGDGLTPALDARVAPARVQVAVVVDPASPGRHLARYDALVVPHDALVDPVRQAVKRASNRDVPVLSSRLAGAPSLSREADKALRGVAGQLVVLLDVRESFEAEIERIVVQLALRGQAAAVVLLAPHEERARARVRTLCDRHGVDAWLASGPDGVAASLGACDLFVGRPSWDELLLVALHKVALALLPAASAQPLRDALVAHRQAEELLGMLQLAAFLDRRLGDPGALEARGIALREALFGGERALIDVLAAVDPVPRGAAATAAWEAVGPQAAAAASVSGVVEARDPQAPAEASRAQKIEDALDALKQKIAAGATS